MRWIEALSVLAAVLLIAAVPVVSPVPKPAQSGQPIAAEQHHSNPQGQAATANRSSNRVPGATTDAPLYVEAACEHGCGYAESNVGFWQKLWADPLALFTAILVVLTFILALAGVRAANAAKVAADLVPALERAYVFFHYRANTCGGMVEQYGKGNKEWQPILMFTLTNHGKTPAIIKEMTVNVDFSPTMAAPRIDGRRLEQEIVLRGEGTPSGEFQRGGMAADKWAEIVDDIVPKVESGETTIWFSIRIVYDDVFGVEHVTPEWAYFAFRNGKGEMKPAGGPEQRRRT